MPNKKRPKFKKRYRSYWKAFDHYRDVCKQAHPRIIEAMKTFHQISDSNGGSLWDIARSKQCACRSCKAFESKLFERYGLRLFKRKPS